MRPGADDFADMLDTTISAADRVQEATFGSAEPVRGRSADGLVEAEIGSGGRLTTVYLEPEIGRMSLDDLAAAVVEAVNTAWDTQQRQKGLTTTGVDLSAMTAQLQDIRQKAVPQMRTFLAELTRAQDDAAARARR